MKLKIFIEEKKDHEVLGSAAELFAILLEFFLCKPHKSRNILKPF